MKAPVGPGYALAAMLKYRLIFGPALILALVALFWVDARLDVVPLSGALSQAWAGRSYLPSGLALLLAGLMVVPVAAWELSVIFRANGITASVGLTAFAAELGLLLMYAVPDETTSVSAVAIVGTGLVAMFVVSLAFYARRRNIEGVVAAAGGTMFAMIYLGLMFGFWLAIRRWHSAWLVLAIILVTKAADIGAYFTGRAIGRRKLIPWLSPGKTWEGLIGGLALSAAVASLLAWWGRSVGDVEVRPGLVHDLTYGPLQAVIAGILFGITGVVGDLTASLLKRDAGIKDSSNLLPGFGGVLDVLDSPLLVAPVAYWFLQL